MNIEIKASENKEIILSELERLKKIYYGGETYRSWQEIATSEKLDPRLTITEVVYIYGELCNYFDGDFLVRTEDKEHKEIIEEYWIVSR